MLSWTFPRWPRSDDVVRRLDHRRRLLWCLSHHTDCGDQGSGCRRARRVGLEKERKGELSCACGGWSGPGKICLEEWETAWIRCTGAFEHMRFAGEINRRLVDTHTFLGPDVSLPIFFIGLRCLASTEDLYVGWSPRYWSALGIEWIGDSSAIENRPWIFAIRRWADEGRVEIWQKA